MRLLAAALIVLSSSARAQGPRQIASGVSGVVVTPVAYLGSGWAAKHLARRLGAGEAGASRAGKIGAWSGATLATAALPAVIVRDGSYRRALGGAAIGGGLAALLVRGGNALYDGDKRDCGAFCWALGAVVLALPATGATVAYRGGRR